MAVKSESKIWAFIAYFLGIIGFIIILLIKKKDKFAMFHAKQSLVLCITWIIVYVAGIAIPFIGWFIIWPFGNIAMFILWIIGIINAITGKQKLIPIIGKFGEKIKI